MSYTKYLEFDAATGFSTRAGFQLTEIQQKDAETMVQWGRILCTYEVGGGKTVLSTVVSLMLGSDVTVVTVPPILIRPWVRWLQKVSERVVQYQGKPAYRHSLDLAAARWVVCSHAIFRDDFGRLDAALRNKHPELIVDECFAAGTKILTITGSTCIEDLKVGDKVVTSAGVYPVGSIIKQLASQLYLLEFSNGKKFTCTGTHPVFSDSGWVSARDCQGRRVLSADSVRLLQDSIPCQEGYTKNSFTEKDPDWSDLFSILWDETESRTAPGSLYPEWVKSIREACHRERSRRDKAKTSFTRAQGPGVKNPSGDGVEANCQRREWDRDDRTGESYLQKFRSPGLYVELRTVIRACFGWLPNSLQTRFWPRSQKNQYRGGREQPQDSGRQGKGQPENREIGNTWLDCVSVTKLRDSAEVWNIGVPGCPNYFAEGILVHNCHAIKNPQSVLFKKVQNLSAGNSLQMLTGTPTSKPMDAYSYIKLKSPQLYRSVGHFERLHVEERDFFGSVTKWQNLDVLAENFAIQRISRTKEEIHGYKNDPIYPDCTYQLSVEHKRLYERLVDEQLLLLDDGTKIDATTAQRLYHNLQQIIINYDYFSGDPANKSAGYELLDSVIDQTACEKEGRSKLIVWTLYKLTSRSVLAYLRGKGIKAVAAYSEADSQKSIDLFMDDPVTRILVGQPQSCGAGLNPQGVCWESLFLETSTTPLLSKQSLGRLDRVGQLKTPTQRFAVAEGTVQVELLQRLFANDDLVSKVERTKKNLRDMLLGRL